MEDEWTDEAQEALRDTEEHYSAQEFNAQEERRDEYGN